MHKHGPYQIMAFNVAAFLYLTEYYHYRMEQQNRQRKAQELLTFDQIPVQQKQRHCTDICCLITGLAFSIVLITASAILFNKTTYLEVNFPTDSDGKLCGYDYPDYQYLFFSNAPLINSRVCVAKCPSKGDITLNCRTNSLVPSCNFNPLNKYYDSVSQKTRMGFFCYPTDPIMKQLLKQAAHLTGQQNFYNSLDSIKSSFIVALILSLVYFVFVQLIPRGMNYAIVALALLALCILIVKTFLFETEQTQLRLLIGLVLLFIAVIIVISLYKNLTSLRIHAILLDYASMMIRQRCLIIIFIPIYLIMMALFIALVLFQLAGFWTGGRTIFIPAEYVYYQLNGFGVSGVVIVVLAIQFIWGAGFLKQSYNYCISGNAVSWFFGKLKDQKFGDSTFYPFKLQVTKNLGSVIACSFVTSFFAFFDLLFDIFKPKNIQNHCCNVICGCICDLVRSDTMSFVILSGNPFCNSARYCEYLCNKSILTEYSQSCSRIYRVSAHFFIASLTLLYSLFFTQNTSIYAYLIILVGSLALSTFFISIHADAAEAIQIIYLLDQEFIHRGQKELAHNKEGLGIATTRKEIAEQISKEYNSIESGK